MCRLVLVLGALVPGCAGPRFYTRDIGDAPRMAEAVIAHVPVGTPIEEAQRFMEREGFSCSRRGNAAWAGRTGLDYLYCNRVHPTSGFNMIETRWQVAIVHHDGKVTEVLVERWLTGP
jgi:hypothetical protein